MKTLSSMQSAKRFPAGLLTSRLLLAIMALASIPAPWLEGWAEHRGEFLAELYSVEGRAERRAGGESAWHDVQVKARFYRDDSVRVAGRGRAGIAFSDGYFIRLGTNASLHFTANREKVLNERENSFEMNSGTAHVLNRLGKNIPTINTPHVSAAIRGTEMVIEIGAEATTLSVLEGQIEARNEFGSVVAEAGEEVRAAAGSAPTKALIAKAKDTVQWTLHYPSLLVSEELVRAQAVDALAASHASRAIEQLARGDVAGAQQSLRTVEAASDPYVRSLAYAQNAMIEIVRGETASGCVFAEKAVAQGPELRSAAAALAYCHQARGDLAAAQAVLEKALALFPKDSFLLARAAEIALGLGDIRAAEDFLARAMADGAQDDPYVLAVQGFQLLHTREYQDSARIFSRAIALDPSLAVAHLGSGIAAVAAGKHEEALARFQMATQLDAGVSEYRSYLGKALFEDGHSERAMLDFELASQLDPEDPTPFFYRSFARLSLNDPIGALADLEAAYERNDNRLVTRSRLILDSDMASRSAGVSRVFSDLGFDEVARQEAISALAFDYRNFSAHRLLSESNAGLFYADASFTERRLADLLSPLSFNLLGSSSGEPSASDYSALFERDESRVGTNIVFDSRDDVYSLEGFNAGSYYPLGYYLSASSELFDGGMGGNFERSYRARGALQYEPWWHTRFLVDADGLFSDAEQYSDEQRAEEYSISAGASHAASARSHVIGQLLLSRAFDRLRSLEVSEYFYNFLDQPPFEFFADREGREYVTQARGSVQHIYRTERFSSVLGTEVLSQNPDREESLSVIDDEAGILTDVGRDFESGSNQALFSGALFGYTRTTVVAGVDLELAGSFSRREFESREIGPFIDDSQVDERFNPKVGVIVEPIEYITFRAAWFEDAGKSSLEDQLSLEPSHVAGFNQRYNDETGTRSDSFGVAVNFKFPELLYGGIEWINRDRSQRLVDSRYALFFDSALDDEAVIIGDAFALRSDINIARAYVYGIASERMVLTSDYGFSEVHRDSAVLAGDIDTHRAAIGMRYFHPSGLFFALAGTYRDQERRGSDFFDDGDESFWTLDSAVGYRLRERQGTLRFELRNMLDEEFTYDDSLGLEPAIQSGVAVRAVLSLNY